MKWNCLFLIRDIAGKDIVEEYLHRLRVLTASTSWKVHSVASHLLPLMPDRNIHFAILPFLLSTCEETEVSWMSSHLGLFESALQSWLEDIEKLQEIYHFPPELSPAEGDSAAKRINDLLDRLPCHQALDIVVDQRIFSDLEIRSNVSLYGALLRAHVWHCATFRLLGSGFNSAQIDSWLDHLDICDVELRTDWMPMWKGAINWGEGLPLCHFELQCSVPPPELTALHSTAEAFVDILASEDNLRWSLHLEVLEEFDFNSLPMHLVIPLPFQLVSTASPQSATAMFLEHCIANKKRCVALRLSFWDNVEIKTQRTRLTTSEWRRCLLGEGTLHPSFLNDPCLQEPNGHLHFVLVSNGSSAFLFPLRKTPPVLGTCLYSNREESHIPTNPEDSTIELLADIPLVSSSSILKSVHRANTLRLATLRNFLANGQSSSHDIEELEKSLSKLTVDESDWISDSAEDLSMSLSDHDTIASCGDPSDWPERRFLVSNSLKGLASRENCSMPKGVISISAGEILKLFDESGRARRKPLHRVHVLGQNTKPSVTEEQVLSMQWPDVLLCKYHDLYYNTNSEALESAYSAAREKFVSDETATTCSSSVESSVVPLSKVRKLSSKAPVRKSPRKLPVSRSHTTLWDQKQKRFLASTRSARVASAPHRRSPRKAAATQNVLQKTVPLVQSNKRVAASPILLRSSPRKNDRKLQLDETRKEVCDPVCTVPSAAEKLRLKLRVAVANALEKNGVTQSSLLYKPCGKKLFAICTTFAQDLVGTGRTSELLQKIADSHAKQVVKFEKNKAGHRKSGTSAAS
ncbi:mdm2-binding protein-like isoform X2 [Amblyomma americanum]